MLRKRLLLAIMGASVLFLNINGANAHGKGHNPSRHQYMMVNQIPSEYRELVNTLRMTRDNLAAGARLYEENCASCHGAKGNGDGEAAKELSPTPADLTGMYDKPMMGMGSRAPGGHMMHGMVHHHPGMSHAKAMGGVNLDAYNFWAISEGGQKMGSSMPAFNGVLSEKERWQILLYVANGLSADFR